jgi:hypothetical protein
MRTFFRHTIRCSAITVLLLIVYASISIAESPAGFDFSIFPPQSSWNERLNITSGVNSTQIESRPAIGLVLGRPSSAMSAVSSESPHDGHTEVQTSQRFLNAHKAYAAQYRWADKVTTVWAGWPFRCLSGRAAFANGYDPNIGELVCNTLNHEWVIVLFDRDTALGVDVAELVPLRPHAIPAFANGGIAYVVLLFFSRLRDRIVRGYRTRSGRCSRCGYSHRLSTSNECPECGSAWRNGISSPASSDHADQSRGPASPKPHRRGV